MSGRGGIIGAATLRSMAAMGLTIEQAADLAEAMEADARPKDTTAAVRQQRRRNKVKAERDASHRDVTRDGSPHDIDNSSPPPIPPVISNEMTSPAVDLKPDHVLEAWNATAQRRGLAKAKMTDERRKKLRTFIRRHTVDDITEAIAAVERSPFLCGENDRGWKADFNWMLEPRNFAKIAEGTYDR